MGPLFYRGFQQWRLHCGKDDSTRDQERRGQSSCERPHGKLIWFHAASNGESLSIISLVKALYAHDPHLHFLITTGTVTSAVLLAKHLPAYAQHQFIPYDVPQWLTKFHRHWRPDVFIGIESELWPNMLVQTSSLQIPMILINACMSEQSLALWKWGHGLLRYLLNSFQLILTQSAEHTKWLQNLGVPNVHTVGNLKFASPPLSYKTDEAESLLKEFQDRPLWLAASTHDGEEEIIIQAHNKIVAHVPRLLTIIVPRHPVRHGTITTLVKVAGLPYAQRSRQQAISQDIQVYLADTVGELGLFYKLSAIVFVGGSLDATGGHNLIEPALLGCALLHGPNMHKQQAMAQLFRGSEASIIIHNADELAANVQRLFEDSTLCSSMQQRALQVAQHQSQVLQHTLNFVKPVIDAVR